MPLPSQAFQTAPAPLLIVDAEDWVESANAAFADAVGHAAGELTGRPLREITAPFDGLGPVAAEARRSAAHVQRSGGGGAPYDVAALPLGGGRVLLSLAEVSQAEAAGSAAPLTPPVLGATEILESISDAFFALDRDWRFTYVNEQAEPLLERGRADLVGEVVWDAFPEAVGTPFWDAYHEAVRTGEPVQFDAFFEPLGRHFSVRAYPFAGGLSVFFADVTESKRAEAAVREKSEALEAQTLMLEAVGRINAMLAAELDPERLVQAVVDAGREVTGATFAAFFYHPVMGTEGDRAGMLYVLSGAPREAFEQFPPIQMTPLFHPTFSGSEPVRSDDVSLDPRYGQVAPHRGMPHGHLAVRSYLSVPVRSPSGEPVGALLFGHPEPGVFGVQAEHAALGLADQAAIGLRNARLYQDLRSELAERERTEAALRRSEARARLALDAARLGLWSWDPATDRGTPDDRTRELLGLAQGEQVTMTEALSRAVHSEDLPAVQAAVATSLDPAGDGRVDVEWRVPAPEGEPRWVRATAQTSFGGEEGERRPVQVVGTLADVTAHKEAERRLLSVVDNLPELAWSAQPDGHIDFYNRRWYAYTGATFEELDGWGWEAVHDPAVLPRVKEQWQRSLETGEPCEMEFPLRRADGTYRWFLTRANPVWDLDGRISRWIGVNVDIHDRKQAEAHAHFLAETGTLVEQALDKDATLREIARLAVPTFADWCSISLRHDDGTVRTVAIAHADPERVRWAWELQETRPPDPDAPAGAPHVIRTGQSELYPEISDELLLELAKDEEELALLRGGGFNSVVVVPVRAGREVIGAVSFVNAESGRHFDQMDLATAEEIGRRAGAALETARLYQALQKSEARARESEGRTRDLFDATPDVVLVYPLGEDGPGPLTDVNGAAVETYGYTRDELLRMRVNDLIVPGSISLPDAVARLREERTVRFESTHRTRDGREIPMEVVAHLVERDGHETVLSVCRDVTERRKAEEALRRKNAEMEQFAYTISHDLKSPLVTITGFLGVLKKHVAGGRTDKALAAADRVVGAADRMGRLIEDLLQLSRAGRVTGDPRPVDLDALVGDLVPGLARRAAAAGGALRVDGPLGSVLADERRLGEVVENLLANAVAHGLGGGGSQITVSSERVPGKGLRVVVADDGPGVPEPYRAKVFELFQRLEGGGEGTGIGLALVARIMEVLGGRAHVEGAGGPPGREGARFVLSFPASSVVARPVPGGGPALAEPSPAGPPGEAVPPPRPALAPPDHDD